MVDYLPLPINTVQMVMNNTVQLVRNNTVQMVINSTVQMVMNNTVQLVIINTVQMVRNNTVQMVIINTVQMVMNSTVQMVMINTVEMVTNSTMQIVLNGTVQLVMIRSVSLQPQQQDPHQTTRQHRPTFFKQLLRNMSHDVCEGCYIYGDIHNLHRKAVSLPSLFTTSALTHNGPNQLSFNPSHTHTQL
jgi:hypothetical protein